jgi:hypothetical protein
MAASIKWFSNIITNVNKSFIFHQNSRVVLGAYWVPVNAAFWVWEVHLTYLGEMHVCVHVPHTWKWCQESPEVTRAHGASCLVHLFHSDLSEKWVSRWGKIFFIHSPSSKLKLSSHFKQDVNHWIEKLKNREPSKFTAMTFLGWIPFS